KGVMISHQSLADRMLSLAGYYNLGPNDRSLQFISLSFDASVEEIFPILITGATLVMQDDPATLPLSDFLPHCQSLGITALHLPAAHWHTLIEHLISSRKTVPEWLRLLITGGE